MDYVLMDKPLEEQMCYEIYTLAHAFSKMYSRVLTPFGLTFSQYLVLLVLWEKDPVKVKTISEKTGMGIGTVNPILNRLEKNGWIKKQTAPEDKRSVNVFLEQKAKQTKKNIHQALAEELNQYNVDSEKLLELKRIVKEINEDVQMKR